MRFVIVTGVSGAGKSTVLKMLEDAHYFCVDNLPIPLVEKFASLMLEVHEEGVQNAALGIDARSGHSLEELAQRIYNLLDEIKAESDKKTYILVAHNGIARVVQSYFTDMTNEEYAAFGVKNCAVVRYDFK